MKRLPGLPTLSLSLLSAGLLAGCGVLTSPVVPPNPAALTEPYRPQYHFSPKANWINDPNGLMYYAGEYHLFYQYNPEGTQWGNISWGHAVSQDLVHWEELPVAILHDDKELVFSGSAVVDVNNTSGLGTRENPPMVAVYTSASLEGGKQAQSLAYSTDKGRTWTKYAGNPVLDLDSRDFRDPKVQWYAPTQSWLMTVSLSAEHKVLFYSSKDLKSWTRLSEFGPSGATGGVWECPDLFPLNVDGTGAQKWVLVVNINPGGIAGGSAAQYFVGDFDGTRFVADDEGTYTPPSGTVVQDFESATFAPWTATGTAFGTGPASGGVDGQLTVSGFEGTRLANSFNGGDASTGTLTSPLFTATKPYLNFKVGGGNHPRETGAVLGDVPVPGGALVPGGDFEGTDYGLWKAEGLAFGTGPARGKLGDQQDVSGYLGEGLVNTFLRDETVGGNGDATVGKLTSPDFKIDQAYINFLIGGGRHPMSAENPTAVNLIVDGKLVRTATGRDAEALNWVNWDVREFAGKTAHIEVVDQNTGGWGHLNFDHVMLSDAPALPRSTETSVNLLVDGQVVQSLTGPNSETLDWASFDLRAYQGRQVQVQLVDMNTGGWGHILADQFVAADTAALSSLERSRWVDYGKDYYAAVSWENTPDGKRVMIGWMNNWQYAGNIPTSTWRGAMSVPREMGLKMIEGRLRLVQQPVGTLNTLRLGSPVTLSNVSVPNGTTRQVGKGNPGQAYTIDATFSLADAARFGLKVRTGTGQETVIGYDAGAQQLYVDRTRSGVVDFSADFPGVQRAPLAARDGKVHLRILVDWSSVEVFGGDGEAVITDQIFPSQGNGIEIFAESGAAQLDHLQLWRMDTYRK